MQARYVRMMQSYTRATDKIIGFKSPHLPRPTLPNAYERHMITPVSMSLLDTTNAKSNFDDSASDILANKWTKALVPVNNSNIFGCIVVSLIHLFQCTTYMYIPLAPDNGSVIWHKDFEIMVMAVNWSWLATTCNWHPGFDMSLIAISEPDFHHFFVLEVTDKSL